MTIERIYCGRKYIERCPHKIVIGFAKNELRASEKHGDNFGYMSI